MEELHGIRTIKIKTRRKPWALFAVVVVALVALSSWLFYLIITNQLGHRDVVANVNEQTETATTTAPALVPRHLDGVLVTSGEEAFAPRAVMVDNQIDARPAAGISQANLAIEAPVEGGITRFMLFFDATTTLDEVGAVRSARPYFVEWAQAWHAVYFHVGGSPEALERLKTIQGTTILNVDEMAHGSDFWRAQDRIAPHNTLTRKDLMDSAVSDGGWATSTLPETWRFTDAATTTERGPDGDLVKVPYGYSYSVSWKFDQASDEYIRMQSGKTQLDRSNSLRVAADNVVVIKTDAQVLDSVGRLKLRTTGSGDAYIYRDGKKYITRWHRSPGEMMTFAGTDGVDVPLNRGKTWIEVTTDDRVFAGLAK